MRYVGGKLESNILLILALTALLLGCQNNRYSGDLPDPNGRYATETTGYSAVVLVIAPQGRGICTGTFISERAVLTATHCLSRSGDYTVATAWGNFATSQRVKFGTGTVDDPNDVSLLVFDEPVASRADGQVYSVSDDVKEGDTLRLVGFGCNDIGSRSGSGVKRTGTNVVANLSEYVEFVTPSSGGSSGSSDFRGILGPENRAGSCFGDSGGPAIREVAGGFEVVGVTHAGGESADSLISEYVNVTRSDNRDFLRQANQTYELGILGL